MEVAGVRVLRGGYKGVVSAVSEGAIETLQQKNAKGNRVGDKCLR